MIDKKAYGDIYSRILADITNTSAEYQDAVSAATFANDTVDILKEQLAGLTSAKANLERFMDPKDVANAEEVASGVIITRKS